MSWKNFRNLFKNEKPEESHFIIGIDLGNAASSIAYFDVRRQVSEIIDISGGYSKPSIPTVMQYITESKEWVFGEYAILNTGSSKDITLTNLIEKIGKKEYIEIDDKPISLVNIVSIFLKELIGNCKNLNPNAQVAGIVIATSSYLSDSAKEELLLALKLAGYEKYLIEFVSDRECILSRYYFDKEIKKEKILLLDFGSRELRGGVYQIEPDTNNNIVKSLSSLFDENLGTNEIDILVKRLFSEKYSEQTNVEKNKFTTIIKQQINSFVYQQKDFLFQKNILTKPIKIYYNFVNPPFQHTLTNQNIHEMISEFESRFSDFVLDVLKKNVDTDSKAQKPHDIDTIICTGGGFEMLWARSLIKNIFKKSNVCFYKNSKGVIAEGASIVTAEKLGVIKGKSFTIEDNHQLNFDIGINITKDKKERFIPLIERNSFWWQNHLEKTIILNDETEKPFNLNIFLRNINGEVRLLETLILDNLPKRPIGAMKVKLFFHFNNNNQLSFIVKDSGFGEFFKKTNYTKEFIIELENKQSSKIAN